MITVLLQGAEFFAHHGYYAEEQVLGCRFTIDLSVGFAPQTGDMNDELRKTINYEHLHIICCREMKEPRKLLETVAQAIVETIKADHPFVEQIDLTLKKLHPPMKGTVSASGVSITYRKSDAL